MIDREKIVKDAVRIFIRKVASGNYKNYNDQEMEQLFVDCLKQGSVTQMIGGEKICLSILGTNTMLSLPSLMQ